MHARRGSCGRTARRRARTGAVVEQFLAHRRRDADDFHRLRRRAGAASPGSRDVRGSSGRSDRRRRTAAARTLRPRSRRAAPTPTSPRPSVNSRPRIMRQTERREVVGADRCDSARSRTGSAAPASPTRSSRRPSCESPNGTDDASDAAVDAGHRAHARQHVAVGHAAARLVETARASCRGWRPAARSYAIARGSRPRRRSPCARRCRRRSAAPATARPVRRP